jgi:hypothetical protein
MSFVVPEITSVTSESLQSEIRRLLPSQRGFTADLQATNVIVPIVDLTAAAEGSSVPQQLQEAQAFGSQTAFKCNNNTVTIANTAGFYKIQGIATIYQTTSALDFTVDLSDGLSTKTIYEFSNLGGSNQIIISSLNLDFVVFLRSGDGLSATSSSPFAQYAGSSRQIADVNGNLVNPIGFTPQ